MALDCKDSLCMVSYHSSAGTWELTDLILLQLHLDPKQPFILGGVAGGWGPPLLSLMPLLLLSAL